MTELCQVFIYVLQISQTKQGAASCVLKIYKYQIGFLKEFILYIGTLKLFVKLVKCR